MRSHRGCGNEKHDVNKLGTLKAFGQKFRFAKPRSMFAHRVPTRLVFMTLRRNRAIGRREENSATVQGWGDSSSAIPILSMTSNSMNFGSIN